MYQLSLQRTFIARHYLIGGDWGAENHPHSHPYRLEIRLEASELDRHGYIVDLDQLEQVIDQLIGRYQDRLLNEMPEFDQLNPSLERFAKHICDKFLKQMELPRFRSLEVRLWENEMAWASYRKDFV
jgi:6-pyruvoyltetrahydropterin/6-carboxytetrahydropterin synthase